MFKQRCFRLLLLASAIATSLSAAAYDFESAEDGCVTVRDRDSMAQERVKIDDLVKYLEEKLEF